MQFLPRFCLSLVVLAPVAAHAQSPKNAPPALASGALGISDTGVTITNAPDGTMIYDKGAGLARVTKDVVITQKGENLIVYAQEAFYSEGRN